ncbi:hypothetical protein DM02DRAFT_733103 [Periconia macrospinosa]|uniref:Lysine-specific metallo-endopeptidase domain-containing protein n=1 Tax=Periconia macrospinosa TaxID=97972 RepID=A0A2V1D5W0_9PLEO|nr:hypothetical protein DM02DRAFT_733103 [Periconia macrospinosa]
MRIDPFLRLATTAIALLPYVTVAAPMDQTLTDGSVLITNGQHGLEKRAVFLTKFSGCDPGQKDNITDAWRNMVDMAEKIKSKIDFKEQVARDFFGDPKLNEKHQNDITLLIQGVTGWHFGAVFPWTLEISCDDPDRREFIASLKRNGGDEASACPRNTSPADYYKCQSRCFNSILNKDGSVRNWVYRATAYTTNAERGTAPVAYINLCPQFFTLRSIYEAFDKYSQRGVAKYELRNYISRESVLMHELMHVDKHAGPATNNRIWHIADRKMRVWNEEYKRIDTIKAYGPLWTKVLANFGTKQIGWLTATNADNLALYFLAKWVKVRGGYYPDEPRTYGQKPRGSPQLTNPIANVPEGALPPDAAAPGKDEKEPDKNRVPTAVNTPNEWDPITIKDGKVSTGDLNDLAPALGLADPDMQEVESKFAFQDPNLDCADLIQGDAPDNKRCYSRDDDKNEAIDLDASVGFPPPESQQPAPKKGALNIILEQTDWNYGQGVLRREMIWLFYPTAFGTASQCSNKPEPATVATNVPNTVRSVENGYMTRGCPILFNEDLTKKPEGCNGPNYINQVPFPAGIYNVGIDGQNCEYKNDGQNNAGALWCDKTFKSSCTAHDDKEKANLDGVVTCDNLSHPSDSVNKKPDKKVSHRAVVACEW